MVNYLHKILLKSRSICTLYIMSIFAPVCASSIQSVCTSYVTSVVGPICASPVPSIHPSDDEHQEFTDEFPSTNYMEKLLSEIMAEIPDNITLTLQGAIIPEETPSTPNGAKYWQIFPVTLKWVKLMVVNLRIYVLGVFQVVSCTMRCVHGSIAKILLEWDPGPTYLVQSLWDPGGPSYSSRSSVPTDLDKLGNLKSYLDYIHLPELSSLHFLVTVMSGLAPKNHLGMLDHMGASGTYLD